jgi:hypothetical protein
VVNSKKKDFRIQRYPVRYGENFNSDIEINGKTKDTNNSSLKITMSWCTLSWSIIPTLNDVKKIF